MKPPSRGNSPNETVSRRGNDSVSLWHSYKEFGGHFVQAVVSLAPPLILSCGLKWETIDPEIWVCLSCGNLPQVTSIYVIGNIWTFWPVVFRATWRISRQIHMSDVSPGCPERFHKMSVGLLGQAELEGREGESWNSGMAFIPRTVSDFQVKLSWIGYILTKTFLHIFGVHCISWPTQTCRNLSEILLGKRCEPASLGLPFAYQFHGGGCDKVNTYWYRFEFEHIFCVPLDVLALFLISSTVCTHFFCIILSAVMWSEEQFHILMYSGSVLWFKHLQWGLEEPGIPLIVWMQHENSRQLHAL